MYIIIIIFIVISKEKINNLFSNNINTIYDYDYNKSLQINYKRICFVKMYLHNLRVGETITTINHIIILIYSYY